MANHITERLHSEITANTSDSKTTKAVGNNKYFILNRFGGCSGSSSSFVYLEWGDENGYELIRCLNNTHDFNLEMTFRGDGSKHFRIVRENNDSSNHKMSSWIEGDYA